MPTDTHLAHECKVFSRYLIGWEPNSYVLEKYCDAHWKVQAYSASDRFNRFLTQCAAKGWWATKLADSYARVLAPRSVLRKKLILLLAILESSSPPYKLLDSVNDATFVSIFFKSAWKGLSFSLSFLLAAVVLLPAQLVMGSAD